MYRMFTFFIVFFFTSMTLNAQTSKEEYDKVVDYCACKIAVTYMTEYTRSANFRGKRKEEKKDLYSNRRKDYMSDKKSFDDVLKKVLEDCKTIKSEALFNLLSKNNFQTLNNKLKNVTKELEKEIKSKKISASDEIINFFYEYNYLPKKGQIDLDIKTFISKYQMVFDKLKKELYDDPFLNVLDREPITPPDNALANKLKSEINRLERMINNKSETDLNSFFPNWLLFILILLVSAFLFFKNSLKNNNLNERIDRRRKEIEDLKRDQNSFNQSSNRNQPNFLFEQNINQKILDLNVAIERLQKKSANNFSSQPKQEDKEQNIPQRTQKEIQKETQKVVYVKTPISEKMFNAFDASEGKEGKFYKLVLTSDNEAEFEFFNTENSAKRALNAPDSFLYPVCDEIEPLNQNATRIITKKVGIVIKQDDKWMVKEKAEITYE